MDEKNSNRSKEGRALLRYLKISPRKVRLVINTIRRQPISEALARLEALNKKAARLVEKGLKSAVASAKEKGLESSRLLVSEVKADGGPMMKRFMARAMGRADQILKRSTHLTIVLREGEKVFAPASSESAEKGRKEKPKKEKAKREKPQKAAARKG